MSETEITTRESEQLAEALYSHLAASHDRARTLLGRPSLTLAEKILVSHLDDAKYPSSIVRGETMLSLRPDRVAMQDATAQMAMLQFMQANRPTAAVPSTIHCDHLIRAQSGVAEDLERAIRENAEVYNFLKTAGAKFGIGFWQPGSGIIHQVVLEKYAFPGGLMIGTDSHTPNAGGMGMLAIGVGGADAAETMAGLAWEVRAPKLIGVHLTGQLNGWSTPKDVIVYLAGVLTTKGGTGKIVEYFGSGTESISATGKATITNMGAELGATTSVFPFDARIAAYLRATDRESIAKLAEAHADGLKADPDVHTNPSQYFDEIIEINLSELEPQITGPHSPDRTRPVSAMAQAVQSEGFAPNLSAALIGSCTNSSFEDLERVANLARQAQAKGLKLKTPLLISPGSQQVLETIKNNGQLHDLTEIGATVLANACGPCIGNWDRTDVKPGESNSIVSSFNRNFPGRNDGISTTLSFLTSPDMVMMYALSGNLNHNPKTDAIDGIKLDPPTAPDIPPKGFTLTLNGFNAPSEDGKKTEVAVSPDSQRLQLLSPFSPWDGKDFIGVPVLIKTLGQTTTDHISPAGRDWLPLRGHLSGISYNMLLGAVDAQTGEKAEPIKMNILGVERGVSPWALKAMEYRGPHANGCIIVGDENYGEGSSREHAAMSPRLLGIKAVIARSFARIHETNLKKQGILPLWFADKADYDKINKGDTVDLIDLAKLMPGQPVTAVIHKPEGTTTTISLAHTLTAEQIDWFKAGSAMNAVNRPQQPQASMGF